MEFFRELWARTIKLQAWIERSVRGREPSTAPKWTSSVSQSPWDHSPREFAWLWSLSQSLAGKFSWTRLVEPLTFTIHDQWESMRKLNSEASVIDLMLTCVASLASLYWWRSLMWVLTIASAFSFTLKGSYVLSAKYGCATISQLIP